MCDDLIFIFRQTKNKSQYFDGRLQAAATFCRN